MVNSGEVSSKFKMTDAVEPSGFVAVPIHSPVNGWGVAVGLGMGVGIAVGLVQAVRRQSRTKVKDKMRILPIYWRIFKKSPSNWGEIQLEKSHLTRLRRGLCAIMHPKFSINMFDIPAHSADRQRTLLRDLRIRKSLSYQAQDSEFLFVERLDQHMRSLCFLG